MGGKTCNHTSVSKKLFQFLRQAIVLSVQKFSVYFTYERKMFNDRRQQHPVASAGPFVWFPIHFRFHSRSCPIRSGKENSKPSVPLHQASRKKPAASKEYRLNVLSHCLEPVQWGRTHVFRCAHVMSTPITWPGSFLSMLLWTTENNQLQKAYVQFVNRPRSIQPQGSESILTGTMRNQS